LLQDAFTARRGLDEVVSILSNSGWDISDKDHAAAAEYITANLAGQYTINNVRQALRVVQEK